MTMMEAGTIKEDEEASKMTRRVTLRKENLSNDAGKLALLANLSRSDR